MTTRQVSESELLPRMAIIGCGAAAREFCLPVLARYPGFAGSAVVVDTRLRQAQAIGQEYGIQHYCSDYQCLPMDVDAAIITTPHHLHAEQSIHFLRQGKSVFVEKPLGMTESEVTSMLEAASLGGATLMVNNCRRLFPAYRKVGEILHCGEYGKILSVEISDGSPFEWNSTSDFYLRDAHKARGVFLDRGAHTVDVLCWWLSDQPRVVEAHSDAFGGGEALMEVQLACGDTSIRLNFGRLYKMANCYTIQCAEAQITGRLFDASSFRVARDGRTETVAAGKPLLYHEYAWKLVENFVGVVQGREPPLFEAAHVAPSISVIDEAYRRATSFEFPWYEVDPNIAGLQAEQGMATDAPIPSDMGSE